MFYEIEREIGNLKGDLKCNDIERKVTDACNTLFQCCSRYWRLYKINNEIRDEKNVLKNYLEGGDGLAKQKAKKNRERMVSLDITSKLYIEFMWKVYGKHYKDKTEKDFFNEIIDGNYEKNIPRILEEVFRDTKHLTEKEIKVLADEIIMSVRDWNCNYYPKYIENLHMDNLHAAMEKLDKLDIPEQDVAESVKEVLSPEVLKTILYYLKAENYPSCIFTIAPVTRALTEGEIKSYTPAKGNTSVFFNKRFEYNLTQLEEYITKLQDLYEEYIEVKNKLDELYLKM